MSDPLLRLEVLVRGTCDCYENDHGWLKAANGEEGLLPALHEIVQRQHDNLMMLTRHALAGTGASEHSARVISALIAFPFWKSLRDSGLSELEAANKILELAIDQLKNDVIT
jgi:hypothetical protein